MLLVVDKNDKKLRTRRTFAEENANEFHVTHITSNFFNRGNLNRAERDRAEREKLNPNDVMIG